MSFGDAVRNNVIRGGVFYYSASESGYRFFEDLTAPLKPWQGYWIYVNSRVSVLFATPTQRDTVVIPDPVNTVAEPPTRAEKVMTAENWKLGLLARGANGKQDVSTRIGIAASASSGIADYPKPPAPIDSSVRLAITKGDAASRYAQVLKTPGAKAQWDLVLETDEDGMVSLLWEGLRRLPKQVNLTITDSQGHVTNLRNASSLKVNMRKGTISRFTVTAQRQSTRPLSLNLTKSASTRSSGLQNHTFLVRLTQDATLTAVVKSMNGTTVAVISSGRASSSGETRLVWNGRSQSGSPVPAGTYQLEVSASSDNGDRVTKVLPVTSVQ
jgi:FlgD Ig-like domain